MSEALRKAPTKELVKDGGRNKMFKFELGDVLEDGDTGFEGVVVARAESLKDPFGLDGIVKSYLLYSIPVLPLSTSFENAGKMSIEYSWYREEGLSFVRKGIKAK